jgi:hypothetical protein
MLENLKANTVRAIKRQFLESVAKRFRSMELDPRRFGSPRIRELIIELNAERLVASLEAILNNSIDATVSAIELLFWDEKPTPAAPIPLGRERQSQQSHPQDGCTG